MTHKYYIENDIYMPVMIPETVVAVLPSGTYETIEDQRGNFKGFKNVVFKSDKILQLPTKEYTALTREIDVFLNPETRQKYRDLEFLYKRSILLYGAPGVGKTCLITQIS